MKRRKRIEKPVEVRPEIKDPAEIRIENEPARIENEPAQEKPRKYIPRRHGGWPK